MMKNCLPVLPILLILFCCNSRDNSGDTPLTPTVTLKKLDSIQIHHLGNPIVHDIDIF